jgi:integrase
MNSFSAMIPPIPSNCIFVGHGNGPGVRHAIKRAKLNPDHFWLHKFRATFATWPLWDGVDLRIVQQWMGHTDLESTLRYLKPNRGVAVREKVNAIFGA